MFCLNEEMTSKVAEQGSLVTRVFPKEMFAQEVDRRLNILAALPQKVRGMVTNYFTIFQ